MRAKAAAIPVARPRLPLARGILPYLRQVDANGWYSNHGPLLRQLQSRLAAQWGLASTELVLLSSGTSALTLALLASGARPGSHCLLPSWTFAASAGAVRAAGLVPHFVDVCPGRWTPDPGMVEVLARRSDVGAILVVAPFGAPIATVEWDAVQAATGVPVVIDAAAAFDTLRRGGPMRVGHAPVVVSLHATKVFGVGEGGALLSRVPSFIDRVRRLSQFGFLGTREATVAGVNAKLSEYAAAVGLAGLDEWPDTRARWAVTADCYARHLQADGGGGLPPGFDGSWVSSTFNVVCEGDGDARMAALSAAGVASLRWWGPGCHAQPAFQDCPSEPLPVTRSLAGRVIGLPFFQAMTAGQVRTVCGGLRRELPGRIAADRLELA